MKKIELSQGKFCLVDDEDYNQIAGFCWHAWKGKGSNNFYARTNYPKGKTILMHRFILGLENPKDEIDHKDGNSLNNQRENLRICTQNENVKNRKVNPKTISGFKGVIPKNSGWEARIGVNKTLIYLGVFKTKEKAARAYNEAALKYHGEFACLNPI